MAKTFYITTPIYYPSGKLHIGNSYTTVLCDSVNRYKKLRGYDTYYLTGMDEHGQKIETVASALNKTPQEHVDFLASETKKLWELLDIEYNDFIRTTEPRHEKVVGQIFEQLLEQDDIYLGHYEGHYCIQCESFFTETQLGDKDTCPDCGRATELVKEESYFLRLTKYQEWLLQYIEDNPNFITPKSRKNEVVSFIKGGLQDLSVSRTSFKWGVEVPSNPKHVIYVWIDALSNYITALGYGTDKKELLSKFWDGDEVVHVVGKDILRFHAIYWPIMLKALKIPVSFRLYAHGWYLMKDGKMSKSQGKVVYPDDLIPKYGLDAMRYFLLKELPYSGDGVFTPEDFVARINYDLANDFGNLLNRTINMINKYFDSTINKPKKSYFEFNSLLQTKMNDTVKLYSTDMDDLKISSAIQNLWSLISRTNKYIDETTPWVLAKNPDKKAQLEDVMYHLVESLRFIGIMLKPILIEGSVKLFEQLNIPQNFQTWESLEFGKLDTVTVTTNPHPLFPRLDKKVEEEYITKLINPNGTDDSVYVDDIWENANLEVGKILACYKHPNANKSLVSLVETKTQLRQIVSRVGNSYQPKDLVGKKVVLVKNLRPANLQGVVSEGMILAGKRGKKIEILEFNKMSIGTIGKSVEKHDVPKQTVFLGYVNSLMNYIDDQDSFGDFATLLHFMKNGIGPSKINRMSLLISESNKTLSELSKDIQNFIPVNLQDDYKRFLKMLDSISLSVKGMSGYDKLTYIANQISTKDLRKEQTISANRLNNYEANYSELYGSNYKNEYVDIEAFQSIEFVAGLISKSEVHPKDDNLVVSKIDIKNSIVQIVSKKTDQLNASTAIGKKVVVIKNIKPVKVKGYFSEGMLLYGQNSTNLEIIELETLKPGDKIS